MGALSTLLPLHFNNYAKRSRFPLGQETKLFSLSPMHPDTSWRYWAATGEQLIQGLLRLDSFLASSTKTEWQPGLHMRAQLTSSISQNHCCAICSHHRVTPNVDKGSVGRRKQSGEKKQKTLSGISTSPCKSASTCVCVNRATCAIGTGDYDSETTDTEAIAATSSDCLVQTWQPWKFFRAEI